MRAMLAVAALCGAALAAEPLRPNVIVILADDIGYGDVGCYGAKPEHVTTPNIDRLAAEGVRFTDAHAASSVCTPSRYSLLTGRYAYRGHPKGSGILPGNAPLSIAPGTLTLPAVFKQRGYATAIVGKWHLGLGNPAPDWNGELKPGPCEIGFDTCFIIPATGDRVPTVFVRDHAVEGLDPTDPITVSYAGRIGDEPTGHDHLEQATVLKGLPGKGHLDAITEGVTRIGYMTGGKAAHWKDEDISDTLLREAKSFIEKNAGNPFFLYLATHGIHEPRVPHPRFVGKSGCGTYGDHILELDDAVGQVMATLERRGLATNTLVVFSSDNGGTPWVGYDYGARANLNGHEVNGVLRGEKGTLWEGGTRIPLIVRWPAGAAAGKTSAALVSQTDLLASFAKLLGTALPEDAAPDSMDVLDALLGKSETGRQELVEHQYGPVGNTALRSGSWKWVNGQLFDVGEDLGESRDVAKEHPDVAKKLATRLQELRGAGRTRP